ncbi:hypothetical protein C2R22_20695 [Salinigranum rubrum]|uniref:DUF1102 domain-containing protein n=1 Tax=Salinigranum rubrum TaxID=755307 RepID=A0A2I8VPB5_9EURY|nr:hypothetical protein [Salinigranum rubrum]AUV83767.1 hypothetical protein C2R22_20695 [Salinigranum rubrum]
MQRRKYLAALGSLAAGGAAIGGTGAFSIVSASRTLSVNIAGDRQAYLGLDPTISQYASINSDGLMELQFDGSNGQNGNGLNDEANTLFQNVFRIVNNATDSINVVITGLDTSTTDGDGVDPLTVYYTDEMVDENSPGYGEMTVMTGSPNPLGDETYGTSSALLELGEGEDAYIHLEFYLSDSSTLSDVKTYPAAIPNELGLYAQGYNR